VERPVRVQLAVALLAGLVLVAVPLYLWRRPRAAASVDADTATPSASLEAAPPPNPAVALVAAALDGGVATSEVTLGRVWVDKCQKPSSGRTPSAQCDRQPFFEEALVRAVLENTSCAPKLRKAGSISFALNVDYGRKKLAMFPGKSGTIRRDAAREAVRCVSRGLPQPDWQALSHLHTKYVIAVLATYPPTSADAR
jgi:hypothetical protein